ncbi:MAG TPA: hypothetical protein VGA53_05290, partial [Candidatus Paceibacterota bacterium]
MLSDFKPEIKLLLIVTAVSVVLAAAGIWLLQGVVRNQVSHTPPVPSPQPQAMSDQQSAISDWQTYRNAEFGFEVKYPKNVEITYDSNTSIEFQEKGVFYNKYARFMGIRIRSGVEESL